MRIATAVVLGLLVAGCGGTARRSGYTQALVVRSPAGGGSWVKLMLSPDHRTYLGQWSGECEVQQTFFVPAGGGQPRPVTGRRGDELLALGWAAGNRARILVPRALCGRQFRSPGVYVVDRAGRAVLVTRVLPRPGGA